ncbi:hypothetical protein [Enterobacter oligotrophicus]|uniref:hypothetical protein n=1 Tax=Enterobacter oligotrophicus TaxID=2478464 RepID=UPI0023EFE8BA|nr:hypothetical protein [Enterobacter oligotrophicus]
MGIKAIIRGLLLFSAVFLLLVVATRPALAETGLQDVMNSLPDGWGAWITGCGIVLYAIAQLRAVMPPSLTSRIPGIIMKLLDYVAANYKHARNAELPRGGDVRASIQPGQVNTDYRVLVETAKREGKLRGSSIENAGDYSGADRAGSKGAE